MSLTLQAAPAKSIYFPELDGLRFFAFLLVFTHHNQLFAKIPYLSILHTQGWIGVDLFFTLSAFLFTKLLITEYNETGIISFKKFYIRRIFRIYPIYFLFIALVIIIRFLMKGTVGDDITLRIIGLFTFFFFFMSAFWGYNPLPYTAHLWSISYEEQFYLFIPIAILLLVRMALKKRLICFIAIFLLFNAFRLVIIADQMPALAPPPPTIWVLPLTHFESILFGIIMGFGGLNFLLKRIKPLVIGLLGVLFFVMLCLLPGPTLDDISYWIILGYTLVGLSTSMVLTSVLHSDCLKNIFSQKLFVFLGKRSYGLYVYHLLGNRIALSMTTHITILPSNALMSFIYSLLFTILLSILSYQFIETPFLKLKKKFEIVASRPI